MPNEVIRPFRTSLKYSRKSSKIPREAAGFLLGPELAFAIGGDGVRGIGFPDRPFARRRPPRGQGAQVNDLGK